ncbi:MAG: hypothetical protein ACTSSG_00765 [Candidatus Heimdallarchaeaceae archaeon]
MLDGFLSSHSSKEKVVSILILPEVVYLVEEKDSYALNFDFMIQGLEERNLFIMVV